MNNKNNILQSDQKISNNTLHVYDLEKDGESFRSPISNNGSMFEMHGKVRMNSPLHEANNIALSTFKENMIFKFSSSEQISSNYIPVEEKENNFAGKLGLSGQYTAFNQDIMPEAIKRNSEESPRSTLNLSDLSYLSRYSELDDEVSLRAKSESDRLSLIPFIQEKEVTEFQPRLIIVRIFICAFITFFACINIIDMFFIYIQIEEKSYKYQISIGTLAFYFLCEVLYIIYNILNMRKGLGCFDRVILTFTVLIIIILSFTFYTLNLGMIGYISGLFARKMKQN